MSRAYKISPDDINWNKSYIEGRHVYSLPSICCPACDIWSSTGLFYPSINAELLTNDLPPANTAPLTPEQFRSFVAKIQPLFGADRPIMPGTKIGPLRGKARGEAGDFAWVNPWTPLMRESVWRAAEASGLPLIGIRAELNVSRKPNEPLVELEACPRVRLLSSLVPKKCVICGRWPIKAPDKLVLEASSFDPSIPLQRVVELPTKLIVNERFAQFIQERKLRDVVLTPVELQ